MIGASNKLNDAAVAKYGDQGRNVSMFGSVATNLASMTRLASDATVNVTGDSATVEPPKNPTAEQTGGRAMRRHGHQPMHFKKEGGKWKFDLSSSASVRGQADTFKAMTQAFSQTADEIKDGKYPTAEEARQALGMRVAAVSRGGRGRGQ